MIMEKLFFNTTYESVTQTIETIAALLLVSAAIVYGIFFALTKLLYRKSRHRKEVNLRLTFLWTMAAFLLVFTVYFYFLMAANELALSPKNFPGLIPQVVVFVCIILYFFIERHSLVKLINNNTIN